MIAIHISGIHCHVPERTKAHIQEKLGNLDRYHGRLHTLQLNIHGGEKDGFHVDVVMHLHSGKVIVARHAEKSLVAAIDGVTGKCATQLRRAHEREREPHRANAAVAI